MSKVENTDIKNKKYWQSVEQYYNGKIDGADDEFRDGVTEDFDPSEMNSVSRRKFLALLSASTAFAATACSDYYDKGEIVPYNKRPEGVLPGKPNYYASYINGNSVLVKTREGRPIHIEGNPDHPVSKGKIDAVTPASLLTLYDPNRLQGPQKDQREISWLHADQEIIDSLIVTSVSNRKIAVIAGKNESPAAKKLLAEFKEVYPSAQVYSTELINDKTRRDAWNECYGTAPLPAVSFDKASVILSLDSDFLARDGNSVENIGKFSRGKDIARNGHASRLYVVESTLSLTGMSADYRLRLRPDAQFEFVMGILNSIVIKQSASKIKIADDVKSVLGSYSLDGIIQKHGLQKDKVNLLLSDLLENSGKGIVVAGSTQSKEAHIAVNLLNEVLGNKEQYDFENGFVNEGLSSSPDELSELAAAMVRGEVGVLINLDSNPIYDFPAELGFEEAVNNVDTVISLVETANDTSALSNFVLPINNALESWGDNHNRTGLVELQQPVIAPLFDTRQKESVLLTWLKQDPQIFNEEVYQQYLIEHFKSTVYENANVGADFNSFWNAALHDGFIKLNGNPPALPGFNFTSVSNLSAGAGTGFAVSLQPSYFIGDGRFANVGWLQEIPHPVSKITWDNYAAIAPKTAAELGIDSNDYIDITVEGRTLNIPAFIQPGTAENVVVIELGFGRKVIGDVGKDAGFNANVLMSNNGDYSKYVYRNADVKKASGSYELVSTQEHHSLDDDFVKDFHKKRHIIREGTIQEFKNDPDFLNKDEVELHGITRGHEYTEVKWGMSIDLNKCISCASCITSCNIENNVPVVGKDQVAKGREMQWMRIDRYYSGTPEEPEASNQPMLCQHCDNAPCENVCPVNATNHSPDGLNQMAYNRCVGTRYCANNCGYKVRRFNFFNFRDSFADSYYENELSDLANNPEVTIRSRGVMEKCTFCVQRIMEARSDAIAENRELKGDDVITACQSACPADAIVFGDLNDKESEVAGMRENKLAYHVLEELYIKPNVTYIAKLKNTHSEDV
jgi:molybdopterin-containing oxidoreductase family iron-sulfur binding subunit